MFIEYLRSGELETEGAIWYGVIHRTSILLICLLESPPKAKKRRVESDEEPEDDTPVDSGQFGLLASMKRDDVDIEGGWKVGEP